MTKTDEMRIVALVQARMGSSRLPGKSLADLCGRPLLAWVLERTRRAERLCEVVLTTSGNPLDDPLAALAGELGIPCFRGGENDVLGRFAGAASQHNAGAVVRICADNPLVAPEEIGRLADFYLDALRAGADTRKLYCFNHIPDRDNNYPDGLGAEIMSADLLARLHRDAVEPAHREHVNEFILGNPGLFDIRTFPAPPDTAGPDIKLDVDTPADLDRMRRLCARLSLFSNPAEIVRAWRNIFKP